MKKPKKQQNHWTAFKSMVIPTMKEVGTPSTKCTGFEKVRLKTKIAEMLWLDAANSKTASVSEYLKDPDSGPKKRRAQNALLPAVRAQLDMDAGWKLRDDASGESDDDSGVDVDVDGYDDSGGDGDGDRQTGRGGKSNSGAKWEGKYSALQLQVKQMKAKAAAVAESVKMKKIADKQVWETRVAKAAELTLRGEVKQLQEKLKATTEQAMKKELPPHMQMMPQTMSMQEQQHPMIMTPIATQQQHMQQMQQQQQMMIQCMQEMKQMESMQQMQHMQPPQQMQQMLHMQPSAAMQQPQIQHMQQSAAMQQPQMQQMQPSAAMHQPQMQQMQQLQLQQPQMQQMSRFY
jgi:hypothetical protein